LQYVNVITARSFTKESKKKDKQAVLLREILENVTERMEVLEVKLKAVQDNQKPSCRPQYQPSVTTRSGHGRG